MGGDPNSWKHTEVTHFKATDLTQVSFFTAKCPWCFFCRACPAQDTGWRAKMARDTAAGSTSFDKSVKCFPDFFHSTGNKTHCK